MTDKPITKEQAAEILEPELQASWTPTVRPPKDMIPSLSGSQSLKISSTSLVGFASQLLQRVTSPAQL
ncbi:hypothetical protein [Methanogenium cariaci]|uniref:hypothetical protein n=1 Tax=Methanogenium cariaci TaxID=2197 RepID=UPI0012F6F46B|nr:hypothetical protein [Methanogenium cariaci]